MPAQIQIDMSYGEISPNITARPDTLAYNGGLATCLNAFPRVTGGVQRRSGTEYVADAANNTQQSYLIDFVYSVLETYVLEFSGNSMRILRDGGLVRYPVGHPNAGFVVIINTGFTQADLGRMHFAQSNDIIYVVSGVKRPKKITRRDHHDWLVEDYVPTTPPWSELNINKAKFFGFSNAVINNNTIGQQFTLACSQAFFNAQQVGRLLRIDESPDMIAKIPPWEASRLLATEYVNTDPQSGNPLGKRRRSNGKVYKCVTDLPANPSQTWTGTFAPKHEEGEAMDGSGEKLNGTPTVNPAGVKWAYEHSGYGVVKIISVTDAFNATVEITSVLPSTFGDDNTYIFGFEAWTDESGYPYTLGFMADRLYFARTFREPNASWGTEVGNYNDFKESSPSLATDAVKIRLGGRSVNDIQHILTLSNLGFLTSTSEWLARGGQEGIVTPETIGDIKVQSYNGANSLQPILTDKQVLFVQYAGAEIRSLGAALNTDGSDGFGSSNLSIFSSHLLKRRQIVDWCYAREPFSQILSVRSDGAIVALTYQPDQKVVGFAEWKTDGEYKSCASILEDNVSRTYVCVKRGNHFRIERFGEADMEDYDRQIFVDSGLRLSNWLAQPVTITGTTYMTDSTVTVTFAGLPRWTNLDVGKEFHVRVGAETGQATTARMIIESVTSGTIAIARPLEIIPEALQNKTVQVSGFAVNSVGGLQHLEGKVVSVYADNQVQENKTVVNGQITLDEPAVNVLAGLPYRSVVKTLPINSYTPSNPQSILHQKKNVKNVHLGVFDGRGLQIGQDANLTSEIIGEGYQELSDLPLIENGMISTALKGVWDKLGQITIVQEFPLPMYINSIAMDVEIAS